MRQGHVTFQNCLHPIEVEPRTKAVRSTVRLQADLRDTHTRARVHYYDIAAISYQRQASDRARKRLTYEDTAPNSVADDAKQCARRRVGNAENDRDDTSGNLKHKLSPWYKMMVIILVIISYAL